MGLWLEACLELQEMHARLDVLHLSDISMLISPNYQRRFLSFSVPEPTMNDAVNETINTDEYQPNHSALLRRRYDVLEGGNTELYVGWADVQGQGAANDYCRVVGVDSNSRFLACSLAGSKGQGHEYVSERGFDVGLPGSWFMRDMDNDGRDDYC
uniref:Uncharacterized protein n=2 Tax=Capitella teleta TaxID=283909 RepID=X2AHY9_CAPTE